MICFRISIFEPLKTTCIAYSCEVNGLWFAFELVSLNHWKQRIIKITIEPAVVICFRISIFEPLKTTFAITLGKDSSLWFAFELVSLNHWKQLIGQLCEHITVVICFRISIFEPLKTTWWAWWRSNRELWFAFELVSLNHWKQQGRKKAIAILCCDLLSN